ncbi:alpha/beta hydrolase family protein [Ornithinibacillus salinisoli]|uniref:Alpha/beta hydrolase family protein n=1 Tax=Ornithinibacillus salinisoli TaxID=1848459 RepID=A0ABW4VYI9_9BACI
MNVKKCILCIFIMIVTLFGCSNDQDEAEIDSALEGNWTGEIAIPSQPLAIQMYFEQEEGMTGTVSIPVQGVKNFPLSTVELKDEGHFVLIMEIQDQYITFEGEVSDDAISGTFKQNGQSFPFQLTKGESTIATDEEGKFVQIETSYGTLYGEMETPVGDGPFPVVIIIPGSGPTDRNGNTSAGENNSLKLLAEGLAAEGIASVRYDKRGAGKNQISIMPEEDMRFEQFVEDTIDWVELLEKDPSFSKIGIIGHSQGSLVGMLAAQQTGVSHFISIAGAGRPIDQVLYEQLKDQLSADLLHESEEIMKEMKQGKQITEVSPELQSLFRPSVQPFTASWMEYDRAEEIKKLEIPTLIINGENDLQVPVQDAELLHNAKADSDLLLYESMNHVLKDAPSDREGNLGTYSNPELPLTEGVIEGIINFLK